MSVTSPLLAEHSGIDNAVDTTANVFRVHYEGADSHLHEIYPSGSSWINFDITATTGGPNVADGSAIANAVDTTTNLFRVHYVGVDSHLHEAYPLSSGWQDFDITAATGGPKVAAWSAIANAVDTTANQFRVHYVGEDSHLHEAYPLSSGWQDFDITAATGGPNVADGSAIANAVDTTANLFRVHYIGVDSHLHEAYPLSSSWSDFDITGATGGPNMAAGSAIANAMDTTANLFRVHYIGVDSHLHEAYPSANGWSDFDITGATGGPNAADGSAIANAMDTTANLFRVHYVGVDSHLHEAYPLSSSWHDFDITAASGGPNVAAGSAIANAVDTTQNLFRVHYMGADSNLHEAYPSGNWYDFNITATIAAPLEQTPEHAKEFIYLNGTMITVESY